MSFLAAAALIAKLPRHPPTRAANTAPTDRRWLALHDIPFVALTVAASLASLQYFVLTIALPLWITLHTHAPRWTAAALFLLAALTVATLQVPATRSIDGPQAAARMLARSGPLFCIAWALIALASGPSPAVALSLLIAAIAIHSLAEVWQAAGAFELSFSLAKPEAQGQYQGVFGTSMGIAEALAPALLVALCVAWGKPRVDILGLVVTLAGLACALIERWATQPP